MGSRYSSWRFFAMVRASCQVVRLVFAMIDTPFGRFKKFSRFRVSVTRLPYIHSLPHVFNGLQAYGVG